ncbi:MAG: DUF4150 domain-containing protein [Oscillochloris sp.]|nr:DUF4150 domain-containing protein [Oscillochloris sp.]
MGKPITVKGPGICFAFPDVCLTPAPPVPLPYPNIGQLADASGTASTVLVGGNEVVTSNSTIPSTSGDEAGSVGGVTSGTTKGKVEFTVTFSGTVFAEGGNVIRLGDSTKQNNGNAVGTVLGGVPTVLVGD